ncbi:MAG: hypothetical protein EHM55_26000, partial [Acidobacteria bacterium]
MPDRRGRALHALSHRRRDRLDLIAGILFRLVKSQASDREIDHPDDGIVESFLRRIEFVHDQWGSGAPGVIGPALIPRDCARECLLRKCVRRGASVSNTTRRRVLQSILAAPALAGLPSALLASGEDDSLIASAAEALDIFDFERLARAKLPPAHWGYLKAGVDGDATLRANDAGFANYSLRVRRLVDISRVDTSVSLLGATWPSPIFLDPVGSQRAFHPDGEIASAKAARTRKHLQILSTVASTGVEDVNAARGEPVWFQLYPTDLWPVTAALVRRVEAADCPVLVLTVDLQGGSNRIGVERAKRLDTRDCRACHAGGPRLADEIASKPAFRGVDVQAVEDLTSPAMGWDYIKRLRDIWPRKLVVKGLVTREDALLAVEHGVDGIIVSNHGGR